MNKKVKQKTEDPSVNSDKFFATLKIRDINRMKKTVNTAMMICLIMMFIVTVLVILTSFAASMKPTPVIAFDAEGKRAVFTGEETVQDETSRVRVYRFLNDFINKFEGVSPNIEEDLTSAYNMLTPNFRQILLDKAVHKGKIEQWKNKNFETKFRIMKIRFLSGSLRVGSTLTVEGIGEMSFRSAIDYSNQGTQKTDFVYFATAMIVTPVSLDISPDGLLVDVHKGASFEDFRSLRAFLLENRKEYLLEDESGEVFE